MELALVIVGGICLMTLIAAGFDFLSKRKGKNDKALEERICGLERKVAELEGRGAEKDERIGKLESDLAFMNKLIAQKPL